jgi:hypothetical protein
MAITTSLKNPAEVANAALVRMGFKLRVGSLFDGSDHASSILDIYGQTRDQMLREYDYDFAEQTAALTLLKFVPTAGYPWDPVSMPPAGWAFEYAFPSNALKIRIIQPQPNFLFNPDPQFYPFSEYNDPRFTPPQRVLLSNVQNAQASFTARITDPTTWDVAFTDALAIRLAALLGPELTGADSNRTTIPQAAGEQATSELEQR